MQRHKLPANQCRTSCSEGLGLWSSRALEATKNPGVQMPHCSAACSRNFCCTGCRAIRAGKTLDRADLLALGLDGQHQTRIDEDAVNGDGTRAAVAVVAAFLGAGEAERLAQYFEQALARLAEKFGRLPVDRGLDVYFAHVP